MLNEITTEKLKKMSLRELVSLCDEIRKTIIDTVMNNGGHLSSNLGMVELTVALHYVFDFPRDKVVFDVGHQCYTHKLLSGRYSQFETLRKEGGLSGFPKREESEYDSYNTGHAGTSISAALGIAKARKIKNEDYNVIAVIGDGSFNNGLIYEAFNSLKLLDTNILVILNDNGMSISPTVGSMHDYLDGLSKDSAYNEKKQRHANIFEKFGFCYDGVYDANDLGVIIQKLTEVKEKLKDNSVILHVFSKKGKGYAFCEENPQQTHGISSNTKQLLNSDGSSSEPAKTLTPREYSQVLGEKLLKLAKTNDKIVAVTAAMTPSLGLSEFFKKYPQRSIDVGICEEHATILCAALAAEGLKPYYAVYSTFLQRSYDEIIIDICSQDLPVTICVDRAGISGADGETHQGVFDLSFLNAIPKLTVAVPKDVIEFEKMLEFSASYSHPLAIRYPRESKQIFNDCKTLSSFEWEKLIWENGNFVIIACGERMIDRAYKICNEAKEAGINVSLINARFVKPLDTKLLNSLAQKYIITMEDNMLIGGLGSCIAAYFGDSDKRVKNFAYRDQFIAQGGVDSLIKKCGIDSNEILNYIKTNATR
jgi:1-deoxy-D-xylulose-5-phosphate synthase